MKCPKCQRANTIDAKFCEGCAAALARACANCGSEVSFTGTVNQIEWAERIRIQVNAEFDRVARVLEAAADKQSQKNRMKTHVMIGILEEKRSEVMDANLLFGFSRRTQRSPR